MPYQNLPNPGYIPTRHQALLGVLGLAMGAAFFGVGYLVGKSTPDTKRASQRDDVRKAVALYKKRGK